MTVYCFSVLKANNLVNCGLWSTIVFTYNYDRPPDGGPIRHNQSAPADLLQAFEQVGLNASDPQNIESAATTADIINSCFVYLYQNIQAFSFADDGKVSVLFKATTSQSIDPCILRHLF